MTGAMHSPSSDVSLKAARRTCGEPSYVPQIDGLRAIAVLAVVGFHAGLPAMSGGYVGVDVFFVISGFLITGLLARELERDGRIDIASFYARRVRRLLPALTVVLASTLVLGKLFLTPVGEQQELANSAIATSAFAANIFFWRTQAGYFAGPAEEQPLLHMWTLAVEEQFYIVWPLAMLLVGAAARSRKLPVRTTLFWALAAGSLASLASSIALTRGHQAMAFYLTPFRAWEFGLGGLLALRTLNIKTDWQADVITSGGLGAILCAIVMFGAMTTFPGYAAALPVVGAAAVLLGLSRSDKTLACRTLASGPMVAFGKLSYSWYLWHWPLLAIARAGSLGETSLSRDVLVVLVALVLALVTYVAIERPIRERQPFPFGRSGMAIASGCVLLISLAASAIGLKQSATAQLAASPLLSAAYAAQQASFPYPSRCSHFDYPFSGLRAVDDCLVGASSGPMLVLWGDSNAFHFVPAFAAAGTAIGAQILPRSSGDCRPYTLDGSGARSGQDAFATNCAAFNSAVLEALPALRSKGANTVVLAARWTVPARYEPEGDRQPQLDALVRRIADAGFRVVLVADVPGYPFLVPRCLARHGIDACVRDRKDVDAERALTLEMLKATVDHTPGALMWDPIEAVCEKDVCKPVRDGIVLINDNQHLSVAASEGLAKELEKQLMASSRVTK